MLDIERKIDLSIFYYVKSKLPSFVTVLDAFPTNANGNDPQLTLPTVSIDSIDLTGISLELGSTDITQRFWAIDVFAKNKSQRDDFAYLFSRLLLNESIPVFDYDQGFPPDFNPPQIGYLTPSSIDMKPVYVFRDLVQDLYWRSRLTFFTKFTEV